MVTFLVELLMVLCRSEMLVTTRLSLIVTFPVELLIAPCGSEVPPTVLLSNLLKLAYERPRPDFVSHAARVFTSSFPSGHATLSAITYLTLGALLAGLHESFWFKVYFLGLAIVLTIVIGISRIYLGVHYPTDVLAGWCIGAAWAGLCWSVFTWLQHRGRVERSS